MKIYQTCAIKPLYVRIPVELWEFLKDMSKDTQQPVSEIVIDCLNKYKKTKIKKITK